jgi:hypothetical protein
VEVTGVYRREGGGSCVVDGKLKEDQAARRHLTPTPRRAAAAGRGWYRGAVKHPPPVPNPARLHRWSLLVVAVVFCACGAAPPRALVMRDVSFPLRDALAQVWP